MANDRSRTASETCPERMFAAADAILQAGSNGPGGVVLMWKDDARPSREGFSSQELVDAMMFLRRMGLVDAGGCVVPG